GFLEWAAGLVFGTFNTSEDEHYHPEIFRGFAEGVNGPSFYGLPFGHNTPSVAIRVGAEVTLSVENGVVSGDFASPDGLSCDKMRVSLM
ncbi:MAG: hypothetical protein MJ106_02960, partial [Lentisphaeria bacterium]|nr:hypothetical protein [Lentisphaeria bacterium]